MNTDDIIAAILGDPADMLARHALADALEESGDADRACLVRVLPALVEVQRPAEPNEDCRRWLDKEKTWLGGTGWTRPVHLPPLRYPHTPGWYGYGGPRRLPAIAIATQQLNDAVVVSLEHQRLLAACELYACGVIDWRRRDAYGQLGGACNGLRGGGAGRGAIDKLEYAWAAKFARSKSSVFETRHYRLGRALARTHSINVIAAYAKTGAAEAACRLRGQYQQQSRQRWEAARAATSPS